MSECGEFQRMHAFRSRGRDPLVFLKRFSGRWVPGINFDSTPQQKSFLPVSMQCGEGDFCKWLFYIPMQGSMYL